ncbi:hypothetical protein ACFQRD_08790 [Brachybacterium sp. GCM10030268]|uniref:hypothetical protein n=1 Tax=Brachybacterium sp. GCM10030268 TaxID=3273382 RepID=UPI0036180C88
MSSGRSQRPSASAAGGRRRAIVAVLSIALGVLGAVAAGLVTAYVIASARITYYLPPAPGSTEPSTHHDVHEPMLMLAPVGGLGLALSIIAIALGAWGLARRRGARAWTLAVPCAALLIVLIVLVIVGSMTMPVY